MRRTIAWLVAPALVLTVALAGCGSGGVRPAVTSPSTASSGPVLTRAVAAYHRYVDDQLAQLVTGTKAFAAAVDAGRRSLAQRLYPLARVHYERVEPVAEAWGSLDLAIDGRAEDFRTPAQFSGFHRLEQLLWTPASALPGTGLPGPGAAASAAATLVDNVETLQRRVRALPFTVLQMSSGATELLDEIEATKVTGEEEQYSHLDLLDIAANVDGCARIVELFAPYLRVHSAGLLKTIDTRLARLRHTLSGERQSPGVAGSGWRNYANLSTTQRRGLTADVAALAEAVSLTTDATSR